jgi:OOP family OmpA-OmpF porin
MTRLAALALLAALVAAPAASAFAPALPDRAQLVHAESEDFQALALPVAPLRDGAVPTEAAEGALRRRVWQIPDSDLTVDQIAAPLRDAIVAAGYDLVLDCAARVCGGFGFRFASDALPAPDMHVDLGDYRHITARRATEDGAHWLAVTVSRTAARGFVQVTEVAPAADWPPPAPEQGVATGEAAPATGAVAPPPRPDAPPPDDLAATLAADWRAVLAGLAFAPGEVVALAALAEAMRADTELRIVLVGHTDADGALAPNIALSRRRAEAVRDRLVERHGIAAERLRAEGVGYLAPLSANATAEGRQLNRRVEAVVD